MCRKCVETFHFLSFSNGFSKKRKALQTLDTKGFEALFSWFKLNLSEPLDVPGGHTIILIYQWFITAMFTFCLPYFLDHPTRSGLVFGYSRFVLHT